MTKKTHEMQAERKENKWATSSVSPGFGFIVLSSVFCFCFFPSSRVKYHHQIGGILFFNSTIGFDSVNFWRVLSQCCVALISGGLAPVHSSSSIRHFLSFLSRRVCVCVVGSSLVDDIEIQLECWPRDGPQSKLGFNFLLYMLLLFPISESVSNGNMGGSWRTGFHFFIGRQRFELRLTTNRHIFFWFSARFIPSLIIFTKISKK